MHVYYWRTWYKTVCGGKGESEGHGRTCMYRPKVQKYLEEGGGGLGVEHTEAEGTGGKAHPPKTKDSSTQAAAGSIP